MLHHTTPLSAPIYSTKQWAQHTLQCQKKRVCNISYQSPTPSIPAPPCTTNPCATNHPTCSSYVVRGAVRCCTCLASFDKATLFKASTVGTLVQLPYLRYAQSDAHPRLCALYTCAATLSRVHAHLAHKCMRCALKTKFQGLGDAWQSQVHPLIVCIATSNSQGIRTCGHGCLSYIHTYTDTHTHTHTGMNAPAGI